MTSSGVDSPIPSTSEAAGLVGKVLSDRYRIEALLGEGGMGAVYLAEHMLMRKRLAVKVLHAEMTRLPEMVARFEREAMAAAHIEHPNVAAATDFGKLENGAFFLVLEYVEGTSLRDVIDKGPLLPERGLHIAYQITAALARAHALGIVHRDLKPENVMLVERDGDPDFVKVLDFGIAKVPVGELSRRGAATQAGQVLTQLGMVYGTPEYMAPEQALGQEVDARADLYALGVMLFEMLTGVRPFEAESKVALLGMKVTSDPPSMASKNPDVHTPESIEVIVRRLLDKEANGRYQHAREVLDALEHCHFGVANTEPPMPRSNATPPSLRRASAARVRAARVGSNSSGGEKPKVAETAIAASGEFRSSLAEGRAWAKGVVERVRGGLSQRPAPWLAAFGGLFLIVALIVALLATGGSSPAGSTPDSNAAVDGIDRIVKQLIPTTAPAEALATAENAGSVALEELASRYPKDPAVWRALIRVYTAEKRGVDAMRSVGKLVAINERAAVDPEVEEAVGAAAQGPVESADAAFALMESGLGSNGPDLLYDLSTSKGLPPRTLSRVKQALAKSDVKARMSPALSAVVELKAVSGCDAKRALLARVKEHGDARALPTLRNMQSSKGCGFLGLADCWSCMRKDNALGATIAAVEERTGK